LAATASTGGSAPPTTIWAFATHLYQTKGVKGFYAGSGPAVIQIIPYMGLNFLIYEMAVRRLRERQQQQQQEMQVDDGRRQHPPVAHSGLAGAVSGAVSKFLVYPMDTIKKRLQIQSFYTHPWDHSSSTSVSSTSRNLPHYHYTSMWDCARNMYQTEGLTSFYRGVIPSLVKSAMAASLTFAIFSSTKQLLQSLDDERRLRDSARKQ
jgi:solute carrier family 25 thiamine pyrophosphate transporter 19